MSMRDRGKLIISIDYEFGWGYADHKLTPKDAARIEGEYDIVRRLIALFEKYEVCATWGIVGHLIDREVPWEGDVPHPDFERPIHLGEKRDWFYYHPQKDHYSNKLWYDTENLVQRIKESPVGHEIGSHSYAHIMYGGPHSREESVKTDLENIGRVNRAHGFEMFSFIFPRNMEGHHKMLKLSGFRVFRGNSPKWYDGIRGPFGRIARLVDYWLPEGRSVQATKDPSGMVNIPDSMLLLGRNGLRKLVPPKVIVKKAKAGLDNAEKNDEIFHLWFHPSNFSYDTETQFRILEDIIIYAKSLRVNHRIHIETMQEVGRKTLGHELKSDNS